MTSYLWRYVAPAALLAAIAGGVVWAYKDREVQAQNARIARIERDAERVRADALQAGILVGARVRSDYEQKIEGIAADVARARRDLGGLRLYAERLPLPKSAAGTHEESSARQPAMVAGSIGADAIADRLAACDRTAVQLNALSDYVRGLQALR